MACIRIDKYTCEACSIIGNYYSLKGEHEKAVVYFQPLGTPTKTVAAVGELFA